MNSYKCEFLLTVKKMVDGQLHSELEVAEFYDNADNETEFLMKCIDYYTSALYLEFHITFMHFKISKR